MTKNCSLKYHCTIYLLVVLSIIFGTFDVSGQEEDQLLWYTSRDAAVTKALNEGKLILLLAGRKTCGNCNYMGGTVCELNDPPIKQVILENYVPWFCPIDYSNEHHDYLSGLTEYTLPLICRIDPRNPYEYIDRSTNIQEVDAFYNRLLEGLGDLDSDGMPDEWERDYGLDALSDDADEDLDGDGFSNLDEYLKKTLPNDAESHPPRAMFMPWLPLLLEEG